MTSKWWQIGLSAQGRQTLFENETSRRKALHLMAAAAPNETLLYGIVDDHLHQIVASDSQRARKITRRLRLSLAPVACCRFEPSYVEPIVSRQHLRHLVRYVLTQPRHHELVEHPALWIGSCFQDLVGARWHPHLQLQLGEHLPRLRLREILPMVELPATPIEPCSFDEVQRLGIDRLAKAASVVLLAPPSLEGREMASLMARRAIAQIAFDAGFAPREVSRALHWAPRTLFRYGRNPVPSAAIRAICIRLALEQLVSRLTETRMARQGQAVSA